MTDTKPTSKIPNPGSKEAIDLGCICPRMDNNMGLGFWIGRKADAHFWYSSDCPLHVIETEETDEDEE